jgi:DNA-directed RNA polymerase subunit RPC12/RpoP
MSPEAFREALDWRHPSITCTHCGSGRVVEMTDAEGVIYECGDCGEWADPGPDSAAEGA